MAVYCALSDHPNLRDSNCWWLPSMDRAPVVVYVWFVHVTPMIRASPSSVISCVNSIFVFLANVELFVPNFREFSFSFRSVVMVVSTNATPDTFVFLVRFNNFFRFWVGQCFNFILEWWHDWLIDWYMYKYRVGVMIAISTSFDFNLYILYGGVFCWFFFAFWRKTKCFIKKHQWKYKNTNVNYFLCIV